MTFAVPGVSNPVPHGRARYTRSQPVHGNTWTRVHTVHVQDEPKPVARPLRLCCPAIRPGDPVQVLQGERVIDGVIVDIYNATIIVRKGRPVA